MTRKKPTSTLSLSRARDICTTIQVRNVPERTKRALASKAAAAGVSLSAYLRVEFEAMAAVPSEAEMLRNLEYATTFGLRKCSTRSTRSDRTERVESIRALKRRYSGSASDIEAMITIAREALPPAQADFDVRTWFLNWIRTPQPCLGGQVPEYLLGTPAGRKLIQRLIGALVGGVYV